MASSIGFRMLSFLPSCYSSYGAWTFTPVGLAPTDHASLRWTHRFSFLIRPDLPQAGFWTISGIQTRRFGCAQGYLCNGGVTTAIRAVVGNEGMIRLSTCRQTRPELSDSLQPGNNLILAIWPD